MNSAVLIETFVGKNFFTRTHANMHRIMWTPGDFSWLTGSTGCTFLTLPSDSSRQKREYHNSYNDRMAIWLYLEGALLRASRWIQVRCLIYHLWTLKFETLKNCVHVQKSIVIPVGDSGDTGNEMKLRLGLIVFYILGCASREQTLG